MLGVMYRDGLGVPQDTSQAAIWFRRAATQGDINAQVALGTLYLLGNGVRQDMTEFLAWTQKAVKGGHTDAAAVLRFFESQGIQPSDL